MRLMSCDDVETKPWNEVRVYNEFWIVEFVDSNPNYNFLLGVFPSIESARTAIVREFTYQLKEMEGSIPEDCMNVIERRRNAIIFFKCFDFNSIGWQDSRLINGVKITRTCVEDDV